MPDHFDIDLLIRERDELREEVAKLKQDAERYRYLRGSFTERRDIAVTWNDLIPAGKIRLLESILDQAVDGHR